MFMKKGMGEQECMVMYLIFWAPILSQNSNLPPLSQKINKYMIDKMCQNSSLTTVLENSLFRFLPSNIKPLGTMTPRKYGWVEYISLTQWPPQRFINHSIILRDMTISRSIHTYLYPDQRQALSGLMSDF